MLTLGLLGGVASGKSFVAGELARLGAVVLDGDKAGHEVLKQPEVIAALVERWGPAINDSEGQINRRVVAGMVFAPPPAGPHELAFLEQITHPRIGTLLRDRLSQLAAAKTTPIAVLDAALLLKAGWDRHCDRIVFVDVPREIRLQRARARGWSDEEFARREAAQGTLEEKRNRADLVIDNSGDPAETRRRIEELWKSLVKMP